MQGEGSTCVGLGDHVERGGTTRCGRRWGWGDEEQSECWRKGIGGVEEKHMAWMGGDYAQG